MNNLNKNNKFVPLLTSLFAFFILVFFTTNIYSEMQGNLDTKKTNEEKLEKLDTKLTNLNKLDKELKDPKSTKFKKINKFTANFAEDEIIAYINDYIEQVNNWDVYIKFNSINFSEKKKSELGFKQIDIDLKVEVQNKFILNNLIDYLTSDINKYSFFITELNFPIEKSGPYKINLPLKMYVR